MCRWTARHSCLSCAHHLTPYGNPRTPLIPLTMHLHAKEWRHVVNHAQQLHFRLMIPPIPCA